VQHVAERPLDAGLCRIELDLRLLRRCRRSDASAATATSAIRTSNGCLLALLKTGLINAF